MDPNGELLTYVISGLAMLWGVVAGGQKVGVIPRKDGNPRLTETLVEVSSAMIKINQTVITVAEDVAVLRRQHGPEAMQGEYEVWKLSPLMLRHLEAAHRKAHNAATMMEVSLQMQMAELSLDMIDGDGRKEFLGSARKALTEWNSTQTEFT